MSEQEKATNGASEAKQRIKDEFAALPLDKKLTSLFEMEVVALNDSISYVVNNSGEVFNKVAGVINDFGHRVETEFKKATQQPEPSDQPDTPGAEPAPAASTDPRDEAPAKGGKKSSGKPKP